MRKFSRTYLSMLWSSITDALNTWTTTFSSVWCVMKRSEEEEEAAATRRKGTAQILDLSFAFSA